MPLHALSARQPRIRHAADYLPQELIDQRRFSEAGFAGDKDNLSLVMLQRVLQARLKRLERALATD